MVDHSSPSSPASPECQALEKVPLVDLKAQYRSIRPEIDAAVARVIASSSFILGPECAAFEAEFAAFCEAGPCAGCANGTDAIALALQALGVGPGDEVVTVAFTFIATAEAVTMTGATPVFVDVCDNTLLMDPSKIEAAITPKTRAILPVHLYGQTVEMGPILDLARRHGLAVVEDAAQAHGARYKGRRAGSMGDAATFSFYPGKNLGAYGDAGAVVTADGKIAEWIRMARDHGRTSKYAHRFESRSSRLDGLQAAILRAKLPRLEAWNARRREIANRYDQAFAGLPGVRTVAIREECEPVRHLYVLRSERRDAILTRLAAGGIDGGIHYPIPLHRQEAYAHLAGRTPELPVTDAAARTVLSIPIYPEMDEAQVERVIRAVGSAVKA
jgi:dTDP-4-amino-4,6-dideoxygalactose transaminase